MRVEDFYQIITGRGIDYFAGVPDSQLKVFCDYITRLHGISKNHVIAANEGAAVALAAGYHLSTGKTGLVYMQNSGLGNAVNPITSLTDQKVYGIPVVYLIGWRGRPGVHDEPQHVKQGEITLELLETLGIEYYVIEKETTPEEITAVFDNKFSGLLKEGAGVAFVVAKGAFTGGSGEKYQNNNKMTREEAVCIIAEAVGPNDALVSTTGKTSRELFEFRERRGQDHANDFLTVGSMGHASMIALAIAEQKPGIKVWCLDGDGAFLMHMGSAALIGSRKPKNYIHVLINNTAHESVGGMPTVAGDIDIDGIVTACGYKAIYTASDKAELTEALNKAKITQGPVFIHVKTDISARDDLGRPTTTPKENKEAFMKMLRQGTVPCPAP